jgi:hypothetical protein
MEAKPQITQISGKQSRSEQSVQSAKPVVPFLSYGTLKPNWWHWVQKSSEGLWT